jgi:hypothetical protein
MIKSTIQATFIICLFSLTAFADVTSKTAVYEFNGQVFKLNKFKDQVNLNPETGFEKADIPMTMDLKHLQSKVKNQGNRGSCAYFAATGLVENVIKSEMNDENFDINISEEYVIYSGKAKYNMSSLDDGSSSYTNLRIMNYEGLVLEKDAPYQPSWFTKGMPCENEKDSESKIVRCYSHDKPVNLPNRIPIKYDIRQAYSVDGILKELANGKSVLIGVPLDPRKWKSDTGEAVYNEEIREACKNEPGVCGGHAILLVGYDLEKEVFLFKNSWGYEWGQKGYGTMPFDYVINYSDGGYTLALQQLNLPNDVSSMPTPTISNVEYTIENSTNQAGGPRLLKTSVGANINYTPNSLVYMSTFLATKNEMSDDYTYLNTKLEYAKEYEPTIRGYSYSFLKEKRSVSFNMDLNPATMTIPHKIINKETVLDKEVFARVSVYTYTDIDGWKVLFREFKPVDLN